MKTAEGPRCVLVQASADNHIRATFENRRNQCTRGKRVVRVVAIDHQADVVIESAERMSNDVTLALNRRVNDGRASFARKACGCIFGVVVEYEDLGFRQSLAEIRYDFADGELFVVAGDK